MFEGESHRYKAYAEGLCWVYKYYYHGCASWSWFYPYHYAPFASDLINLDHFAINFVMAQPFSPLGQLMGVLPAASAHALPPAYAALMRDPASPIAEFYPTKFEQDFNGKRYSWQAVVLLPWIDEKKLLTAIDPLERALTGRDKTRNSIGPSYLFCGKRHPLANTVMAIYDKTSGKPESAWAAIKAPIPVSEGLGLSGFISPYQAGMQFNHPPPLRQLPALSRLNVISVLYDVPPYIPHRTTLLPGAAAKVPPPVVTEADMAQTTSIRRFGGNSVVQKFLQRYLKSNRTQTDQKEMANAQALRRFLAPESQQQQGAGNMSGAFMNSLPASVLYGYQNRESEAFVERRPTRTPVAAAPMGAPMHAHAAYLHANPALNMGAPTAYSFQRPGLPPSLSPHAYAPGPYPMAAPSPPGYSPHAHHPSPPAAGSAYAHTARASLSPAAPSPHSAPYGHTPPGSGTGRPQPPQVHPAYAAAAPQGGYAHTTRATLSPAAPSPVAPYGTKWL